MFISEGFSLQSEGLKIGLTSYTGELILVMTFSSLYPKGDIDFWSLIRLKNLKLPLTTVIKFSPFSSVPS